MTEGQNVVAEEVAQEDFERLVELWDINTEGMDEDDTKSFDKLQRTMVKAICKGAARVTEEATVEYDIQYPTEGALTSLTFKVPKGNAFVGMDRFKDRQNIAKFNSFMGAMTGKAPAVFNGMDGRDVKFCQAVTLLFMAS